MTNALKTSGTSFGMTGCPACSCRRGSALEVNGRPHNSLKVCERCGALLGRCYRGDSPVLMVFDETDSADVETRYFALELLGSDGISFPHGWFNPATMKVVQFG